MTVTPISPGFTHLHVHSHFTLLGATASPAELAQQAAADGLTSLALTDRDALYGAVVFDRACREAGIHPILGMSVSVAPPAELNTDDGLGADRLVLLATGPAGYRSLCRLSSEIQAYPDRVERAARGLDWETLKANRAGLICLSGGRRGWMERCLRAGNRAAAVRYAGLLAGLYDQQTWLALEIHRPEDQAVAAEIAAIGQRFGIPAAAVQPVYALGRQERSRLKLLAAIGQNCRLDEVLPGALADGGDPGIDLHWLKPAEVAARFETLPAALQAAADIAAACGPAIPDGRPIWPALKLDPDEMPDTALAGAAEAGLRRRFGQQPGEAAQARLQRELAAIARHGFSPLFLLVSDVVRFARENAIPVSTRGSVANSLVAYCIGITTVDPLEHDLLFERFLNPARRNPPDIDLDFCSRRRDRVLAYVRDTYGAEQVALVATVSTMRPKSAVRETAKAFGLSEEAAGKLAKLAPSRWHPDPRRRSTTTLEDVAATLGDPTERQVLLDARGLVGQPDHLSVHPGAVIITPGPLTDVMPVQWTAKGFLISQYDHRDVEAIGLPKIDLLGIRALTVLADSADLVRRHLDAGFRLEDIPLDDPATAAALERGDTIGVFQCDSSGAQRTLRQLKARSVKDLAVANAFFKPGPALGGMARQFVLRYRGEAPVTYLHPALEPILGRTKGVLIFQEQILRIATEIAGLSWAQADHLRRGMSHFGRDEMAAMQTVFVAGCMRPAPDGPGFTQQQAATLWDQVLPFAGYGFNQGHATAYADVSYRSTYMRVHYPAPFFAARLANFGGYHHPAVYMAEARRLGIPIYPPHVNHSGRKFTLEVGVGREKRERKERRERGETRELEELKVREEEENGEHELAEWMPTGQQAEHPGFPPFPQFPSASPSLWMGLSQVRDLRRATVRAILSERRRRPFRSLRDLLNRVDLQAKEALHLVQCGALDGLGASRAEMLVQLDDVRRAGSVLQASFDFDSGPVVEETDAQRLAWEMHLLGWPVSVTPLDALEELPAERVDLASLPQMTGQLVSVIGYRLPGWTGGKGFFLADGHTYVIAIGDELQPNPRPWQPLHVTGRWRSDQYGTAWFIASGWTTLG